MTEQIEEKEFRKRLFVAVHAGAGFHSQDKASEYKKLCRKACLKAMSVLSKKESAVKAVTAAVSALEDSELSNAGRGSSLTMTGSVECDACVMEGTTSLFGAVGCLSGVLNPVKVAGRLLEMQQQPSLSLGRIPPSVLAGEGAREWAKQQVFSCDQHSKLVTDKSRRLYLKYKRKVEQAENQKNTKKARYSDKEMLGSQENDITICAQDSDQHSTAAHSTPRDSHTNSGNTPIDKNKHIKILTKYLSPEAETTPRKDVQILDSPKTCTPRKTAPNNDRNKGELELSSAVTADRTLVQDTVGALCVDWEGHVSAAVSSGGIWLKQPGRLGPAAMFGAACWAQDAEKNHPGVAVIASGCGEHLMRTLLAKTCADCMLSAEGTSEGLNVCFQKHFLESRLLKGVESRQAGAVAIRMTSTEQGIPEIDICWGHTTDSMAVGYMSGDSHTPKTVISRLSKGCHPGRSFAMAGDFFSSPDS
ncbi:threonine aspartase 1-like [Littorina saxatilis]|uniref:Threonine aspartase 1 n=1 Tax=Littorina saxatilis TaxID=31220 RepID=A0AAN9BDG4_9CAEN